jgi:hypothetical protein
MSIKSARCCAGIRVEVQSGFCPKRNNSTRSTKRRHHLARTFIAGLAKHRFLIVELGALEMELEAFGQLLKHGSIQSMSGSNRPVLIHVEEPSTSRRQLDLNQ